MRELKIKTESKPKRCEICHQSDLFDPTNNCCKRCVGIIYNDDNNESAILIPTDNNDSSTSIEQLILIFIQSITSLFIIGVYIVVYEIIGFILLFLIVQITRFIGFYNAGISLILFITFIIGALCLGVSHAINLIDNSLKNKQDNIEQNNDINRSNLENAPYWEDKKNIYA